MSTPEKRAREDKRDQKQREKEMKRQQRRQMGPREPELVDASDMVGNVRSIDEVMRSLLGEGAPVQRSAAALPTKLFVGSLSDGTSNATLRKHFEPYGTIAEAVVITDRNTGVTRNFGFVTMADRKDAPAAIQALHHSELDGNRIVVSVATERR